MLHCGLIYACKMSVWQPLLLQNPLVLILRHYPPTLFDYSLGPNSIVLVCMYHNLYICVWVYFIFYILYYIYVCVHFVLYYKIVRPESFHYQPQLFLSALIKIETLIPFNVTSYLLEFDAPWLVTQILRHLEPAGEHCWPIPL